MHGFRKKAFHDTSVARKNAVLAEDLTDFSEGDRVMTVDGFPGKVTAVLYGPYQGTESYQVELDGGMGGGDYSLGQLKPFRQNTASREVEAAEVYASIPVEAVTDHTANVDYPELEDILTQRLPNERIKIYAGLNGTLPSDTEITHYPCDPHDEGYDTHHHLVAHSPTHGQLGEMTVDPDGEIDSIDVAHEHQRKGVATALWNHARDRLGLDIHHSENLNDDSRAWASHVSAVNKGDEASEPDITKDDPGENLDSDKNVEDPSPNAVDDPNPDPQDPDVDAEEAQDTKLGDVKPPDACSYCGNASFGDSQMTGRGVRMRCDQCGGTMVSWGGQWQPEFPNSSQNHASETWDYRSGGPGGIGQAPGGQPFTNPPGSEVQDAKGKDAEDDDEDGKTIKVKISSIASEMDKAEIAQSLQAEAGIVQFLFNRLYQKAREHYDRSQVEWWQPPAQDIGTSTVGPARYDGLVQPKQVSVVGSTSKYSDPDWRWHYTASWMDVQAKAKRIRKENHVSIIAASKTFVSAEVLGDTATYETQLNFVPGTRKVADWACGCKWGSYTWGRSKRYQKFEGRLCSHALATQYEANARSIFGRDVERDSVRPDWQNASTPIVVQYNKADSKNLSRPTAVKRVLSSRVIDTDGIFPEPDLVDLAHPPIFASVQTMIDNDASLPDVIEMMASFNLPVDDARSLLFEALLSPADPEGYLGHPGGPESASAFESEASKQHHKHKTVTQEHGRTWGYGFGWGWGPCGMCGGSGCNNCNGTGQVAASDPASVGDGGVASGGDAGAGGGDGGGGAVGGGGATAASTHDAFDYGHDAGYDYADRLYHHQNGYADQHPGDAEEEKNYHANSWFDQRHRQHVIDGFEHGHATWNNEQEAGLPHRGGSIKTADYSTADPLVGLDGGHNTRPTVLHSNSQNPASTGWATGQDPGDWGKSLISNDFGVTFDAALHSASSTPWTASSIIGASTDETLAGSVNFNLGVLDGIKMTAGTVGLSGIGGAQSFPRQHVASSSPREQVIESYTASVEAGSSSFAVDRSIMTLMINDVSRRYIAAQQCKEKSVRLPDLPLEVHMAVATAAETSGPQMTVVASAEVDSGGNAKWNPPTVSGVMLKAHDTGRVLMIQRGLDDKNDPAAGTWEAPGGHHEPNDITSLHAGIREWEEEVGHPFPSGGHVSHVWRSGPYQGHVVVIPSEDQMDFSKGRQVDNPDGDRHEQVAWWDPDHAKKNPALRQELKASSPFGDIKKAAADVGYMSEAALDFQSRMMDATLNDEPEGALPSTTGDEDVDADPGAGNTGQMPGNDAFQNNTGDVPGVGLYNTITSSLTEEQQIIAEFQRTAGAQALRKAAMKDFSFEEQQELINEGKGDRARNFNDLKIAGTHYELIGDGDDDETILWV